MKAFGGLAWLALLAAPVEGFVWPIDHHFPSTNYKFTFSELFMYSNADAPLGLRVHEPTIKVNVHVMAETNSSELAQAAEDLQIRVATSVFHVPVDAGVGVDMNALNSELQEIANDVNLCSGQEPTPANDVVTNEYFAEWHDGQLHAHVDMTFDVKTSGVQSVIMEVCDNVAGLSESSGIHIHGEMVFRNPYGYLSGIYFGYMPFEGTRAGAFVLFAAVYFFLLVAFRDKLIRVQYFILAVVLIAALESAVSFASYVDMNERGEPYCCPFPDLVVTAMVLEVLRRTLSRALLLLICLGFGVVRTSLTVKEWVSVVGLSLLYFAASLTVEVRDVVEINDLHRTKGHSLWWDFPVLLFDLTFLIWIYLALVNTMAALKESQQSVKLDMYAKLGYVMAGFVLVVSILTLIIVLARAGAFTWPWQLYWMQTVAWDLLNLAVLVAVSIIWAPDERSKLLATSQQLATCEEDTGDFSIEGAFDIEMTDQGESDEELDLDELKPAGAPDEIYSSIPSAAAQYEDEGR